MPKGHIYLDPRFRDIRVNDRKQVKRLYRCLRTKGFSVNDSRYAANAAIDDSVRYCPIHDLFNCWLAH